MYFNRAKSRLRGVALLESAMQSADLNGLELAKASGVSHTTVNNLRNGRAPRTKLHIALAIERALNVQPGDLFEHPPTMGVAA